ncbi:hypothetical protein K1719_027341 [Acacia pycnantha]|nr:hypothetical protein K1719_027341 [Acacia pycnantha]
MNDRNNDEGDYNNVDMEADAPPFPRTTSCIAAMGTALLLLRLMSFIFTHFTIAVYVFTFYLTVLYWFRGHDLEDFDPEDDDDEKAMKFLKAFLRAVKGNEERGRKEWKKVGGSIGCFGSEEMVELGYRECSICMDEFEKGDKCLVFPGCGHIFHCKCIARWLKMKKLTCPFCRSSVDGLNDNGTRVSELIALTSTMALIAARKAAQTIYIFNGTHRFVRTSWAQILAS